jgi:parallel beta-helix repeat protein
MSFDMSRVLRSGRSLATANAAGCLGATVALLLASCGSDRATPTPTPSPSPPLPTFHSPAHMHSGQCPAGSRLVSAQDDLRGLVSSQPEGTQFCLSAGTYSALSLTPRTGDGFYGMPGAVLDGAAVSTPAFIARAPNVTIAGLVIRGYKLAAQTAAIDGINNSDTGAATWPGWQIIGNQITAIQGGRGVTVSDGWVVRDNIVSNNGELGLAGSGANIVIENNELLGNNQALYAKDWEAGGAKFTQASGLVFRGNYVHDNLGPGLWCDIDCHNVVIERNDISRNQGAGIFFEISQAGTIRGNRIFNNGQTSAGWIWDGGIQIAASSDVVVSGNWLLGNANGVSIIQQRRGQGQFGQHLVAHITVDRNTVDGGGRTGAVEDDGDTALFNRGIHFTSNTYHHSGGFAWLGGWLDWNGWRAAAQDVSGSWLAT